MHRRRNGAIGVLLVALIVSQNLIQISAFQLSADPPKGEKTGDQGEDKAACGCKRKPADMSIRSMLEASESLITGPIHDCCCNADTVEMVNDKILPILNEIVETNFFRYYKLNLWRECNFFPDDGQCSSRGCAVDECAEEEFVNVCQGHESGNIDASLDGHSFQKWLEDGDPWTNDADVMNIGEHMNYVDLMKNPERFTGYSGPTATRIWKAIYDENCFVNDDLDLVPTFTSPNEQCIEKRVFYRLISGLHSSISTHLTWEFSHDLSSQLFAPNIDRFYHTVAKFPARVHNMYLTYLMLLRAVSKALPTFYQFDYKTPQQPHILSLLHQLSDVTTTCPNTFDENVMFQGQDALTLKSQFKNHFRNISVILDCVACERCKLWGKLQINGLGTALKILFDSKATTGDIQLERTELVALLHTFRRLSESLKWSNLMFKDYVAIHAPKSEAGTLHSIEFAGGEKGMSSDSPTHDSPTHDSPTHDSPSQTLPSSSNANELSQPLANQQIAEENILSDSTQPDNEVYATPPKEHFIEDGKWFADPLVNHKPINTPDEEAHLRHKPIPIVDFDDPENDTDIVPPYGNEFDPQEETSDTQASLQSSEQIDTPTSDLQSDSHSTTTHENTLQASHEPSEEGDAASRNDLRHGLRHERHPILDDHPPRDVINSLKQDDSKKEEDESVPQHDQETHPTENQQSGQPAVVPDTPSDSNAHAHHSDSINEQNSANHADLTNTDPNHQTGAGHSHNPGENHDHRGDESNILHENDHRQEDGQNRDEEHHQGHEDHHQGHEDHHHQGHEDHHHQGHEDHHHQGHEDHHHHSHGHSHGQMGLGFGGNDYGMGSHMGGGHHHGGHDISKETRDLSSMSSSGEFVDPDLEGFDLFLAHVEEYWRITKVTCMDFYFGVVVPALRENSSWYSGLAILTPVFLLFLLALRRHPDPFVPFQEPLYRPSNKKSASTTSEHAGGSTATSRNRPSDQSFAPSPGFVKGSPVGNPTSQPIGVSPTGGKDQKIRTTIRKPGTSSGPGSVASNPIPSMLAPSHISSKLAGLNTPTKTPILAPVNSGPPVASKGANHSSSYHPSPSHQNSTSKPEPKAKKSEMKEMPHSASIPDSASSESPSLPPIGGGAPLPMPSLKGAVGGPKQAVVAPRPRRAIPVPGAAKK